MALGQQAIPQGIIQEVYIPIGNENTIEQVLNQDIIIYVLGIPDLENTGSIQTFIQTNKDTGNSNNISQNIEQNMGDFPLFPNHFTQANLTVDNSNLSIDFQNFINNDGVLDGVQFTNQQILVKGNNNSLDFYSEQTIYDLSWYDKSWFDQNSEFNNTVTFDDFLQDFVGDYLVDSVQFGVQDIRVLEGSGNIITQEIDQTLATFILLDDTLIQELQASTTDLPPVHFVIQENFVDTNNNTIDQTINQNIKFDFTFSNTETQDLTTLKGEELTEPEFSIEDFIYPILDNTDSSSPDFANHEVNANQNNVQKSDTIGNGNTDIKTNSQVVVLNTFKNEPVFASLNSDILKVGITKGFDGLEDLIFVGSGNDLIDVSQSLSEFVNLPITLSTNNRIYGGSGHDEINAKLKDTVFGGSGDDIIQTVTGGSDNRFYGGQGDDTILVDTRDIAFGNSGNDILDATLGNGQNRLYGDTGNDTFYLGINDELNGGEGDDLFYVGENADNTITGGVGKDIFWVITSEIPSKSNTITDFNLTEDSIGIGSLGSNPTLSFQSDDQGNTILGVNDSPTVAIFLGVQPSQLEKANFIFD